MMEIMTPHEAAEYLNLNVRTIYHLARDGKLPGHKVGRRWRFKKDVLDKWLSVRETPSFKDQ
jgi:excisionase family DNA binding protein